MAQTILYFAYGSNLNEGDMAVRCPGAGPDVVAQLPGWRLTFRGVANIEPAADTVVLGALWRLTPADVESLDLYEGCPTLYRQRTVDVETQEGRLEAMTYVMPRPGYLGLPSEWYFERIREGYRSWGLPLAELEGSLEESRAELDSRGIERYEPDGRKRLRAIVGDADGTETA